MLCPPPLHAQARRDLAEQRKQREVCKAAAGGHDGSGGLFAADVPRLHRVERLVQQLLPPPATPQLEQQQAGQQEQQYLQDEQQHKDQSKAADHGPKLPAAPRDPRENPTQLVSTQGEPQLGAATELQQLLGSSAACCIYFRVCGGLKAATSVLASAAAGQQKQQQLCVATLELLSQAADNVGNLHQLSMEPGFLPAAFSHLHRYASWRACQGARAPSGSTGGSMPL